MVMLPSWPVSTVIIIIIIIIIIININSRVWCLSHYSDWLRAGRYRYYYYYYYYYY